MRRQPSLRSQLNQIRLWVRQGRTDAWIAHKLDIGVDELTRFKVEHQLDDDATSPLAPADPLSVPPPEPRAEEPEDDEEEEVEVEEDRPPRREREASRPRGSRPPRRREPRPAREEEPREPRRPRAERPERDEGDDEEVDGERRPRRRRGRRGGKRHRARRNALEATFDHGEEGYGLWLDPAVVDNPVYAEHWAGHRAVTVTLDAEAITIRRTGADRPEGEEPEPDELED